MEQKIKEIIRQVGDIGEKLSRLPAEESLPAIELDILLGDIRDLYQMVKDLQPGLASSSKEATPVRGSAGTASGPAQGEASVPEAPVQTGEIRKEHPAVEGKKTVPAAAEKEKKEPAGKPEEGKPSARSSERAILADKYKSEKQLIHESLAGGREDIGSKIQSKPIRNIGSALGVNDRFKLIKELFNGDKDSFQNTIGILDGASNFNEAFNYIDATFDWDMEEDSVQLLLDLVRRKFIVNQNE